MLLRALSLLWTCIVMVCCEGPEGSVLSGNSGNSGSKKGTIPINIGNIIGASLGGNGLSGKLHVKPVPEPKTPDPIPPKPPSLGDEPPPGDKNGDQPIPACMDLMIVLDISCSITIEARKVARDYALFLLNSINLPGSDIRVGFLTYSDDVRDDLKLGAIGDAIDALNDADLNTDKKNCATRTDKILQSLYETYFTFMNGDRPNADNVALLFTDGRTNKPKFSPNTEKQAAKAKGEGNDIEIRVVAVPHRSDKNDLGEFKILPSREDFLYSLTDESFEELAGDITGSHDCTGLEDSATCFDMVFAIDISCSIDQVYIDHAFSLAKQIARITGSGLSQFAGLTFAHGVTSNFGYVTGGNDAVVGIDSLDNVMSTRCRTATNKALVYAKKNYFDSDDDRDDETVGDIMIVFGDGNTAPWAHNKKTLKRAELIKAAGGTVVWVKLPSNRSPAKVSRGIEEEIKKAASNRRDTGEPFVYDHDDPVLLDDLVFYVDTFFKRCEV